MTQDTDKPVREVSRQDALREVTELLPCPFCGGKASINTNRTSDPEYIRLNGRDTGYGVNCIQCSANTRGIAIGHATPELAAEKWNRRTGPALLSGGGDAVPVVQQTAPKRIWLAVSDDAHDEQQPFPDSINGEVTWSDDTPVEVCVPYVRADLAAAPAPAGSAEPDSYPECSGDPADCPENEGFGCCGGRTLAAAPAPGGDAVRQIVFNALDDLEAGKDRGTVQVELLAALAAAPVPAVGREAVGAIFKRGKMRHFSQATTPEEIERFHKDNPAGWEFDGWLYTAPTFNDHIEAIRAKLVAMAGNWRAGRYLDGTKTLWGAEAHASDGMEACADNVDELLSTAITTPPAEAREPVDPLVEEGLAYFEKSGDAGDKMYVAAIRRALTQPRDTPRDSGDAIRVTLTEYGPGITTTIAEAAMQLPAGTYWLIPDAAMQSPTGEPT